MQFKKGSSDRRIPEYDQAEDMTQEDIRNPGEGRPFSFSRSQAARHDEQAAEAPAGLDSAPATRAESIVDATSSFDGHFSAEGDLRIQGNISGEVTCRGMLTIEQHAVASARINTRDAEVLGTIDGDITCTGRLRLAATAVVNGTINAGSLVVEEGAAIHGSVETQYAGELPESGARANRSRPAPPRRNERSEHESNTPTARAEDADTPAEAAGNGNSRKGRSRDLPSFALVSSDESAGPSSRES